GDRQLVGEPTEVALLTLAIKAGFDPDTISRQFPRLDDIPFESERASTATLHPDHQGRAFSLLKGAPEIVLALCKTEAGGKPLNKADWLARVEHAAGEGERVLALAWCEMPAGTTTLNTADISPRFELLGMVGLIDPPREE